MENVIKNGMANVYTPYNPYFVNAIKGIGKATWNREKKCWVIPETAIDAAREIMINVYGYSDITENETISLKVYFNEEVSEWHWDVVLFGKVIAHAYNRDSGARIGDDVAFIHGGAMSGGSVKNWESIVEKGSVVILSNVNKNIYEKESTEYDITVEVLETEINKQELLSEKERLLKRVAEIDKLLIQYETECTKKE